MMGTEGQARDGDGSQAPDKVLHKPRSRTSPTLVRERRERTVRMTDGRRPLSSPPFSPQTKVGGPPREKKREGGREGGRK